MHSKIDFFVVGAARCGTTTLYHELNNLKEVYLPLVKETNFYSNVESDNYEDYLLPKDGSHYHSKIIKSVEVYNKLYQFAQNNQKTGDISPSYLWDTGTAQRIFNSNPNAKIIISLRNPVDRAYSHYVMNYFTGSDKSSNFKMALDGLKNEKWGNCTCYMEMGLYYHQVKSYFNIFPTDNIKILVYENWVKDVEATVSELCDFLDISSHKKNLDYQPNDNKIVPLKNLKLLNGLRKSFIKRWIKAIIDQETIHKIKHKCFSSSRKIDKLDELHRRQLLAYFKEDVQALSDLTHINFKNIWGLGSD